MKHIVVLVGNYYPHYSAVGNCAEKIITLLKNDFKISVVAAKNDAELNCFEEFDGYDIYRIESKYQKKLNRINFEMKNNQTFFTKFKLYATRAFNLLKFVFQKESIDKDFVENYLSQLNELHEKQKIDVIIPLVFPFETVMSAIQFQNKTLEGVIILPYLFDNFSASVSLHRFKINRKVKFKANLKLESMMLEFSSRVFAMHPLQSHFERNIKNSTKNKIMYLEHPLLQKRDCKFQENLTETISFTYTGGLFRGVRTADSCLCFLSAIAKCISIKVDFYCFGNDQKAIDNYSKNSPLIFTNHGRVDRSVAEQEISNSDVLISIGDTEGKQLSSKIFDYLSMGKPIIHFSYVDTCVNSKVLQRYPLAFIIKQDSNDEYSEKVINNALTFIIQAKNRAMTFYEVADLYSEALPETTANLFKKQINELCERAALI